MPIVGLTDTHTMNLPRIGKLRKGDPKVGDRPGADTDHFRFTSPYDDIRESFRELYGEQEKDKKTLRAKEVVARLPYATIEENFPCYQEKWLTSGLDHRCDGQTTILLRTPQGMTKEPHPCPGDCKPTGYFNIILPGLPRLGVVEITTHSKLDIIYVNQYLRMIQHMLSVVRGGNGDLTGAEILLTRQPQQVTVQTATGQIKRTVHVITPMLSAAWAEQTNKLLGDVRRSLIQEKPQYLLTDSDMEDYDE
jgi:hypothetical protein